MTRGLVAPLSVILAMLTGCANTETSSSIISGLPPEATMISAGQFEGRNDHVVTGRVSIAKAGNRSYVELGSDFSLDGAPDPKIGFGNDGSYDPETTFTVLESKTGSQFYLVPDSIDVTRYNEVYIWCDEFSVSLGVASVR